MFRLLITFIALTSIIFSQDLSIKLSDGYPRWLKDAERRTDQTSGIAFIGIDKTGDKNFLLADDIGVLHRLIISNDTIFTLKQIGLSAQVTKFLDPFPKKDFEEILFDKHTGKVLLSIEGNEPMIKSTAGIYEIAFYNNNLLSDSVTSIKKLNIEPEEVFFQYVNNNIGFEGLAADSRYYYAALEGFSTGFLFADSTMIYVINKKDLSIKKVLSTRNKGIQTICGLYSDKDYSLYGIDRNNRKLFHMEFNDGLDIQNISFADISPAIPNYTSFDYVSAFESITFDNDGLIYIVDDPWRTFYIPSENILSQLDEKTIRNFKSFIPIIYKFKFN
jgi:hypothetical protein